MASTTALRTGPECSGIPEVLSGLKTDAISPPLDTSLASSIGSDYMANGSPEPKGEATYIIPGECERLFCDKLTGIFLGERRLPRQESLGVDASRIQLHNDEYPNGRIGIWVEVLDYTSDLIYRGFVTDTNDERALFVFLPETSLRHGLKSGLIALFELASMRAFGCSQIVACVPRSQDGGDLEITRNLGWCGFGLTTLQPWDNENRLSVPVSTRWIFLSAEV